MAKIISGARRINKKDPLQSYGKYTSGGRVIRRSTIPEAYKHSWSAKVKKNRQLFADIMENYSKMDIVTKQAYTEAIFLQPPIPIQPFIRWLIDKTRKRWPKHPPFGTLPLPSWIPWPWLPPSVVPTPNPNIDYEPWPWPDNEPWGNQRSAGGHNQALRDGMGWGHVRNPTRNPLPGEMPLPGPEPQQDRRPQKNPVIITVEIDPEGWLGTTYNVYLKVQSEYSNVTRWVVSHKKETVIIVAFGTLVLFSFGLFLGGVELEGGTELLVTPAAERFYALSGLMIPGVTIKHIENSYFKLLEINTLKKINIWAQNLTRGWHCYIDTELSDYSADMTVYTGPSKSNKEEPAAYIGVHFDWENRTADMVTSCYKPKDTVAVYEGNQQILVCGEIKPRLVPPWLYNYSTHEYGEAKMTIGNGYIKWAFEDRPVWGDGDYNDAYFIVYIDKDWNITGWRAIEGNHCDELGVFWLGIEWGHFPRRC